MSREIDALTSSTLRHLRDRWWNDAFTAFLEETLRPRPGTRILDVGCGTGMGEVSLARLRRLSQMRLFGVDLVLQRLRQAREATRGMNARASYAAADACRLPFPTGVFDSSYCVAVLQHIRDFGQGLAELARVTAPGGRILVVEPDNTALYWFSSLASGLEAFELGRRFFAERAVVREEPAATAVGPRVAGLFATNGIEPLSVQLFPVSVARVGAPPESMWEGRRRAIRDAADNAPNESLRRLGSDYLKALERYANDARAAGSTFVEIQNTLLFATVGQRAET
jgi:ubiquinone/menaquinone biosynthesis C-methylase UbiE